MVDPAATHYAPHVGQRADVLLAGQTGKARVLLRADCLPVAEFFPRSIPNSLIGSSALDPGTVAAPKVGKCGPIGVDSHVTIERSPMHFKKTDTVANLGRRHPAASSTQAT
jgi:hypothetical protein